MTRPLAIDLYAGLGGWAEGLIAEGWDVIGFDIERHVYGEHSYPEQLVIADVRSLDGARFKDASLIVASPPCQEFSYRAMPWKRAKALGPPVLGMELFEQPFRIQREACAAAGRYIPLIVENVRGAQPWVGHARWNFGSFYLWGDVPALMPVTLKAAKMSGHSMSQGAPKWNMHGHWTNPAEHEGIKQGGDWFNAEQPSMSRLYGSKSPGRKFASAMIAKIPFSLASWIGQVFRPHDWAV